MNCPKFVIASDGYSTGVLLDGVFIGKGVERIEFVADGKSKEAKIRVLELDVKKATLEKDESKFAEFMDGLNFEKRLVEEMAKKESEEEAKAMLPRMEEMTEPQDSGEIE